MNRKKSIVNKKGQELSLQEQEQINDRVWESIISEVLWQNEIGKTRIDS